MRSAMRMGSPSLERESDIEFNLYQLLNLLS